MLLNWCRTDRLLRTVFRCPAFVDINGRAIKRPYLTHEWRPCGSWLMVNRGHLDRFRTQMFVSFVVLVLRVS